MWQRSPLEPSLGKVLTPAAVSACSRGDARACSDVAVHPGSVPLAWAGWEIAVPLRFPKRKPKQSKEKLFLEGYGMSWSHSHQHPGCLMQKSGALMLNHGVGAKTTTFFFRSRWPIVNHSWPWTNINPELCLLTYTLCKRKWFNLWLSMKVGSFTKNFSTSLCQK